MSRAVPAAEPPQREPVALQVQSHEPGLTLRVWEWDGEGRPVLLLHGSFGMSARVWDPVARALPGRRVLAPDARGHGDSDRASMPSTWHEAGPLDLAAVVDALSLDRFALVGHSMGAYAAIRYGASHPGRLERLVLLDAGPDLPATRGRAAHRRPRRRPPITGFETEADYAAALGVLYPRADTPRLHEIARHWLRRRPDGRYEPKLDVGGLEAPPFATESDRLARIRRESERLWSQLASIACPTLVVRAALSTVLSAASAQRMLAVLDAGTLVEIAGVGHALMLEAPERLAAVLSDFLTET